MNNNKIGCHVNMCAPNYLVGSLQMALEQNANCFMIYTGAPQSSIRIELSRLKISEFKKQLDKNKIIIDDVIVHSPYILNLANDEQQKRENGIKILSNEVYRTSQIGCKYLVLHPGNNKNINLGCHYIAQAINKINLSNKNVVICLETMAGKGNEIGFKFEHIKEIINEINDKNLIGVCLDTCHINDAGYDLSDPDKILNEFDKIIGLKYLKVLHINDSLNPCGTKKDRHANIGQGTIGLSVLKKWVNHPLLINLPKILETPWTEQGPIYKNEIEMLTC